MSFFNYIFTPRLYKIYGDGPTQKLYEPGGIEKLSDQVIATLSLMWNISYYTSPLIVTILYRRGYFITESITTFTKVSTGIGLIVMISLCMRGFGRYTSIQYTKFFKTLQHIKMNNSSFEAKEKLRMFDFDFKDWPSDFSVHDIDIDKSKRHGNIDSIATNRRKPLWKLTSPCEVAAFIAIHTFGIRMIYPGMIRILQSFLHPILVQGRAKLIEEEHGKRFKLKTIDGNFIDALFIDNRLNISDSTVNGNTLIICSEGNAGFYEIGIMTTPIALKYSVLGWNHPGFAGSTGMPFPSQDQNALDAVILFAIHKLGFQPENILLFGWSIGGYSSLVAAVKYPDIKGVILDATFDDLLHLAIPRMPESISGIVRIAIRDYVNLNNSELISQYKGPVLLVRRTEDEIISENTELLTNRGNYLLIHLLKTRFPNVFNAGQINRVEKILSKPLEKARGTSVDDEHCYSLILSYVSEHTKQLPTEMGKNYTNEQRSLMADFLIKKHLLDFKSSHCTPLPTEYFQIPWSFEKAEFES